MAEQFNEAVIGAIGRVSVPISDGRSCEVILPIRGGTEAYSALADQEIAKNNRVVVVEVV